MGPYRRTKEGFDLLWCGIPAQPELLSILPGLVFRQGFDESVLPKCPFAIGMKP